MKNAFEPVPLLVAAVAGAIVLYLVAGFMNNNTVTNINPPNFLLLGAITGVGVQVAVRVAGVS